MSEQEPKQELITQAKALGAPAGGFSLTPRTFEEAFRFANLMAESDLLPKEFHGKPANVLVAVQLGMELGVSPMQALQNIYVVNGRPALYGDLLPAIVFNSGLMESIHEEGDETTATCTVKRKGHEPISRTFTWKDAERAKIVERNPTYKAYPKRMLQMRARSWAIRDMFPDVLKGVAVKEELDDSIETTATREPEHKPIGLPQPAKKETVDADQHRGASVATSPGNDGSEKKDVAPGDSPSNPNPTDTPTAETKPTETPKEKVTKSKKGKATDGNAKADRPAEGNEGSVVQGTVGDAGGDGGAAAAGTMDIAEALAHWIETCSDEEIGQQINQFTKTFNDVPKDKQMALLRPYNERRQALAKKDA
jgi:hypothetical protein